MILLFLRLGKLQELGGSDQEPETKTEMDTSHRIIISQVLRRKLQTGLRGRGWNPRLGVAQISLQILVLLSNSRATLTTLPRVLQPKK